MGSSPAKDVEELFTLHGSMVYGRALCLLGRREDAEEAVQEVFIRVMRSLDRFEQRSKLSSWLFQITTNYCIDVLKQRSRQQRLLAQNMPARDEAGQVEGISASDLSYLRQLLSDATSSRPAPSSTSISTR